MEYKGLQFFAQLNLEYHKVMEVQVTYRGRYFGIKGFYIIFCGVSLTNSIIQMATQADNFTNHLL